MDELLLFIYFLVVFFVLYKMALSLEKRQEDRVIIHVDEDFLAEQTQNQLSTLGRLASHIKAASDKMSFGKGKLQYTVLKLSVGKFATKDVLKSPDAIALKKMGLTDEGILALFEDKISIRVTPTGQQRLRPISYISVFVNNETSNMQLYVNWDRSSIDIFKQGNRVIRSTPNMPRDLTQGQIHSVVNPQRSMSADVTIERNFAYDPEVGRMVLADDLVNLEERVEFSQVTDPSTEEKNIQPLYTLDLMIGVKRVTDPDSALINLLVPFVFTLEIEPDQIALPPLRWLLRHIGRRNRPERSIFWGK
ncbi:MAG: hypothetical protein AAGN15_24380 [Cyanobacteria bacterium J06581_3]